MKKNHSKKPAQLRETAISWIKDLFIEAEKRFHEDSRLADRYVELARKIKLKYKVRMPGELKLRFCKGCLTYWVPGINVRIRTNKGKLVYYCLKCKEHKRIRIA